MQGEAIYKGATRPAMKLGIPLVHGRALTSADTATAERAILVNEMFVPWGLQATSVNMSDLTAVRGAIRDGTRLIWVETPSNPLLTISDIEGVVAIARQAGAMVVVDNTWATPICQRPLELGADISMHASTKYLGGHSDVMGGILVAREDNEFFTRVRTVQHTAGGIAAPFDSWLVQRGIKTLAWRVRAHTENALAVTTFLVNVAISLGLIVVGRIITTRIIGWSRRRGTTAHRTVLIGGGALAAELAQVLIQHRRYGLVPVGYVDDDADGIASVVLPRLGGLDDLDLCVTRERADVLLVTDSGFSPVPIEASTENSRPASSRPPSAAQKPATMKAQMFIAATLIPATRQAGSLFPIPIRLRPKVVYRMTTKATANRTASVTTASGSPPTNCRPPSAV